VSGFIPDAEPGEAALFTGGSSVNKVALTFDDGLCAECVYGVLDLLDRTGTAATMFPNGIYADRWDPNVDLILDLVARGQIEFGNHSYGHDDLRTLKRRDIARDLRRNEEWIWKTFRANPRPLTRPPFGAYDDDVIDVAGRRGYTEVVTWSSSGLDWELTEADAIVNSVRDTLKPGAIILLHPNSAATVDALPAILDEISDRGLEPVLLSELLAEQTVS
jgi:peptidoglycan/xylan/chitin deacetylase (PgdA/CDA1 family)